MRDDHTLDYYEILQVHVNAEPEIIKAAYKRLTTKYHPDVNKNSEAEEMMKRINTAYSVLSDPARRAEYDQNYKQKSDSRNNQNEQQTDEDNQKSDYNHSNRDTKAPFNAYDEFWEAVKSGETEKIKSYIEQGADVNVRDKSGGTPLHSVAEKGHKETAELLIEKGGDVNAKDALGRTPLHETALFGHTAMAELLIASGAEVNAKDKEGKTSLHLAFKNDHIDTAELIFVNGTKGHNNEPQKNLLVFTILLSVILLMFCYIFFCLGTRIGYNNGLSSTLPEKRFKYKNKYSKFPDILPVEQTTTSEIRYAFKNGQDYGWNAGCDIGYSLGSKLCEPALLVHNGKYYGNAVIPVVYIFNNTPYEYENCEIILNSTSETGGYRCKVSKLESGEANLFGCGLFYNNEGESFKIGNVAVKLEFLGYRIENGQAPQKITTQGIIFAPDK